MPTQGHYAEALCLARILQEEGLTVQAAALHSALEDSFTATEILMKLRWQLRKLRDGEVALPHRSKEKLDHVLAGLELALEG